MVEFLKTLLTFAEFPPTVETTFAAGATRPYRRWRWRWCFRGRPMSDWAYSSRIYGNGNLAWAPYARYCDAAVNQRLLSRQLRYVVEEIIADG